VEEDGAVVELKAVIDGPVRVPKVVQVPTSSGELLEVDLGPFVEGIDEGQTVSAHSKARVMEGPMSGKRRRVIVRRGLPYAESSFEATSLMDHHGTTLAVTVKEAAMKVKRSPMEVYGDLDTLLYKGLAKPERLLVYLSRLMMAYMLGMFGKVDYKDLKELSEVYIEELKSYNSSAIRPEVRRLATEAADLAEEREELKPMALFVKFYLSKT
jgi:hypothetical protein